MNRPADQPLDIAVLISGGGTTLRNLLECIDRDELNVRVALVISSLADAGGLAYAAAAGIPSLVVRRGDCDSAAAFRQAVFQPCRDAGVALVVMGGFLKHLLIPADFEQRVVNIHPSLIPAFCGKGFYGMKVHQAVLDAGVEETGCTIHFVDNKYDHGPIILQRRVAVEPGDTAEQLAARVFATESEAYPQVLQWISEGRVSVRDGTVVRRD